MNFREGRFGDLIVGPEAELFMFVGFYERGYARSGRQALEAVTICLKRSRFTSEPGEVYFLTDSYRGQWLDGHGKMRT